MTSLYTLTKIYQKSFKTLWAIVHTSRMITHMHANATKNVMWWGVVCGAVQGGRMHLRGILNSPC